jgi:hypothetical protein
MPKGLGRALAGGILGAVKGYGEGLAESGTAKRELMLKRIEQFGLETLRSTNRREELGVASRLTTEREREKSSRGLIDTKNLIEGEDGQLYMVRKNPKTGKPDLISLGIKGRRFGGPEGAPVEVFDPTSPTFTTMVRRKEAIGRPGKSQAKQVGEARRADEEEARIRDRQEAERRASEKAGYFSTDKTDFPETGGDREAWSNQEAERIGRERRAREKQGRAARPQTREAAAGQPKKDVRDLSQYPEGQKFKNKETGQILIKRGGRLVPE